MELNEQEEGKNPKQSQSLHVIISILLMGGLWVVVVGGRLCCSVPWVPADDWVIGVSHPSVPTLRFPECFASVIHWGSCVTQF